MIVLILMTSIHFPLNTKQDNFFSFHDLQAVDTSGPPPARHAPSAARLGGRPLLRSCTDCCCWAPWPWRTGGWDPRGSPRRSSCHSGCQTVTGWCRKAPPKKKKKKKRLVSVFHSAGWWNLSWPVLRLSSVLPRSRPRSSAGWRPGRGSSPTRACQTSPQTASRPARFPRSQVSNGGTEEEGWSSRLNGNEQSFCWSHSAWSAHNYLSVWIQGEQLESGLAPETPGLYVSGALRRGHKI